MEPQDYPSIRTGATVNKKTYSTSGGVTTVRPVRFFGIFAAATIFVSIIASILIVIFRKDITIFDMLLFVAFITVLGLPLLLFSFVQRYYIDSEKIVHRNMIGVKKQLYWKDIKTVRSNPLMPTDIKLYGAAIKIKIYPSFYFGSGSELILKHVRKNCTDAEWKSVARIFS